MAGRAERSRPGPERARRTADPLVALRRGGLALVGGWTLLACSGAEPRAASPLPGEAPGAAPLAPAGGREAPSVGPSTIWGPERRVWTFHGRRSPSVHLSDLGAQCSDGALRLARAAGIADEVTDCEVLEYRSGDEALEVVRFHYGPAQDCESGCFQDGLAGLAYRDEAWVARVPYTGGGTAHGNIAPALRDVLPDLGIADPERYEWYDVPEGFPCANDEVPVVVTEGDSVQWEYALDDGPRCLARLPGPGVTPLGVEVVLGGRVVLPIVLQGSDRDPSPDYSQVAIDVARTP